MDMIYDFGAILKELRSKSNLTQEKLAKQIGITKAVVSRYETNQIVPPFETVRAIARIFNVSLDYLGGNERGGTVSTVGISPQQVEIVENLIEQLKKSSFGKRESMTNEQCALVGQIVEQFIKK